MDWGGEEAPISFVLELWILVTSKQLFLQSDQEQGFPATAEHCICLEKLTTQEGMVLHASDSSYSQDQIKRIAELKNSLGHIVKFCLRWKQKVKFWQLLVASPGISPLPKAKLTSFMAPASVS